MEFGKFVKKQKYIYFLKREFEKKSTKMGKFIKKTVKINLGRKNIPENEK